MLRFFVFNMLIAFFISSPVYAAQVKTVSVLGFEAPAKLNKKAAKLTKILRNIVNTDSHFKLLPNHEFEEAKLMYCEDENNQQCLKKIAQGLSSDFLIAGKLSYEGNMLKLSLILLDTHHSKKGIRYSSFTFNRTSSKSILKKHIKKIWKRYFVSEVGQIKINAPSKDIKVFIDGQFALNTLKGQNLIPKIPMGNHKIKAQSPNGKVWEKLITVQNGKVLLLNISFNTPSKTIINVKKENKHQPKIKQIKQENALKTSEENIKNTEELDSTPINKWKLAFWVSASTSALMIVSGIYTGIRVKQYEQDKDDVMSQDPAPYAGISDVCKDPTPEMKDICNNGKSMAMWTNILFASGITVGIVSSYFMYKGYMDTNTKVSGAINEQDSSSKTFILTPVFSSNGAGISFTTKF